MLFLGAVFVVPHGVLLRDNPCLLVNGGLCGRIIAKMTFHVLLVVLLRRAKDNLALLDVLLGIDAARRRSEGGTGEVVGLFGRGGLLWIVVVLSVELVGLCGSGLLGVVLIPLHGVVHLVGEQIAGLAAQVVRHAEEVVEVAVGMRLAAFLVGDGGSVAGAAQRCVLALRQHFALGVGLAAHRAVVDDDVGLLDELGLVAFAHQVVVPIADGIVQAVGVAVDDDVVVGGTGGVGVAHLVAVLVVVGIDVGLHLAQRHLAVRCRRDGERYLHLLGIGVGRAGVGRDVLVIDVDLAADVPIVGRRGYILVLVHIAVGIAVIHNLLGVVHEVAGSLDGLQRRGFRRFGIFEAAVGAGRAVLVEQRHLAPAFFASVPRLDAVLVAGIDVAAAHAGHDVDKVKSHHAGDVAPLVLAALLAFLALDFQEHAGG